MEDLNCMKKVKVQTDATIVLASFNIEVHFYDVIVISTCFCTNTTEAKVLHFKLCFIQG